MDGASKGSERIGRKRKKGKKKKEEKKQVAHVLVLTSLETINKSVYRLRASQCTCPDGRARLYGLAGGDIIYTESTYFFISQYKKYVYFFLSSPEVLQ